MRKMWNLITNENIKVFAKISTVVMLAIIVALVAGYFLLLFVTNLGINAMLGEPVATDYDKLIQTEQQDKNVGWEIRVEQYTFMRDNTISQYADWRALAVDDAYALKAKFPDTEEAPALESTDENLTESAPNERADRVDEEERLAAQANFDAIMDTIKKDDWKTYLKDKGERVQEDQNLPQPVKEAQGWSIQFRIDHDVKPEARDLVNGDWKNNLIYTLENSKRSINEIMLQPYAERDQDRLSKLNNSVLVDTYRLEKDINVHTRADDAAIHDINVVTKKTHWKC
ncbi:MAG: hypothetical protein FWG14_06250 [Peptococcaceae bacterium]|nr:hypothetical protein [Peptococcaceae bacterium]